MSALQPGQSLLHYRILEKIGQGGMGEVYKAEDLRLGRTVALKLLPPETAEDKNAKRRLLQEARAASALNHPNIVTIYSIEQAEGFDFIVMELVEGETLRSLIERGPLEASRLLDLGSQAAEGLFAAHSAGLIHRDIKSSNILVTPRGQAKILDFGLVKVQLSDEQLSHEQTMSKLTGVGMIVGTVATMSPEQTRGEPLDARTDIFSLGCVLYEAATGRLPFSGPSVLSVLHEIATTDPPAPSSVSRVLPQGLDAILKRAMAKSRELRYSSAAEFAEALRSLRFANRYQILREIGRGGMGVVYLARDPMLERDVAIKVVTPALLGSEAVERFKREARVVANMDHPAIVGVHDIGEHADSLFFVMPFIPGTNLRFLIKEGSLSLGGVIDIGIQVAEAIEYSHSKGVVHRDIKPENIMIAREESAEGALRVRVTDFGLAMASAQGHLTKTGTVVGTIAYLSPEQVSGDEVDSRSDIYSLGTVLYECLVGQPPFSGEIQTLLYRIAHETPQPPRLAGSDIPVELEQVVLRSLEKDPARRPQRAREVAEALHRLRPKLRESERAQKLSMTHRTSTQVHKPVLFQFVGREKELADLQQRLNLAVSGECQFMLIGGEAGVGKSRLLDELERLTKVRKIPVLHGRFAEQDRGFPYQGFCEVIQEYFHLKAAAGSSGPVDFSDLASDLVSLFPVLAEMDLGSGRKIVRSGETKKVEDRTAIFDLMARSFLRIGGGKPLVIFFEDLHNVDVSIDALEYVVRRMGPTPTLVAGTYRTSDVDKRHPLNQLLNGFRGDRRFLLMNLQTFSPAEHREFLETTVGGGHLDERFATRLYEATEGNAYFTQELVRSLIESGGAIRNEKGVWTISSETAISSGALPSTIQQVFEKRIKRLPEELKEVLSLASVIGRSFDFRDVELLAESKDMEDALDQLVREGLLIEERESRGDRLMFSSGVVRDVLYAELSRRKRRSLHRKYAEELERRYQGRLERVYSELIHHYSNGDVPEKVVEYGLKFARKSLDAFSAEDAIRVSKTVLDFFGDDEEEVDRSREGEARMLLAQAYRMAGDMEEATAQLGKAVRVFEREKKPQLLVNAVVLLAETAWEARKFEETRRWVDRGIEVAKAAGDTTSLSRLLSLGSTVANLRADYEKAKQYLQQAEQIQRATQKKEETIPAGGRLITAITVPLSTLHPTETKLVEESEVLANVFETLVTTDEQGHLIPCLCESWESLGQGTGFVLTLQREVKLHDGSLLTAQAVKSAFEKAMLVAREGLPAAFAALVGTTEYLNGTANQVSGLEAQSEGRLVFKLKEQLPIYPALLTDPRTGIACGGDGSNLVGSGPFRISDFTRERLVLERNAGYWKGFPPLLDAIEFRTSVPSAKIAAALRTGEIDLARDLLPEDLEQILREERFKAGFVEAPKKNCYYLLFNHSSPVGRIAALRHALCGVIQMHDLVWRTVGHLAQPAEGLLPPGILGHDPGRRRTPLPVEKARELFESTGLQVPLRLKASVHPVFQDRYAGLLHSLFKAWESLGVEVSNATPDTPAFLKSWEENEGIDLMLSRWIADYEDPDSFIYALFYSEVGHLRKYLSSKQIDEMVEAARAESRPDVREKLYRKIEELLIENGLLPLFHDIDYRVAGPKVRGLKLRSNLPFVNYSQVGKVESERVVSAGKVEGGVIHIPDITQLFHLDPTLTYLVIEGDVSYCIYDTLTRDTGEARVAPWLASEFHAEQGGRIFRIRLRDDVRFHNGKRLTSRDVRYTFERLLRNKESKNRWVPSAVQGSRALLNGEPGDLTGFRILSALEFEIKLDQPLSIFPALLAHQALSILPEGADQFRGNWREGCVGTGPFRVSRFEPGKRLELEANPDYWIRGYPRSEGLIFTFGVLPQEIYSGFRSGLFTLVRDLLPSDVDTLRRDTELAAKYLDSPNLSTYYLAFNIHNEILSDEDLRHRIIESMDVNLFVRRNLGRLAVPASSLIPPGLLGYEPAQKPASTGLRKQKTGTQIELRGMIHRIYHGPYAKFTQDLFDAFEENGFRIKMVDYATDARNVSTSDVDFILVRWIADYPDADTFAHEILHSKDGVVGHFCGTPETDHLIEKARTETDPKTRHSIYRELEERIADHALLLPLFHEQSYRFARPEVEGLELRISQPTVPYEKLRLRR